MRRFSCHLCAVMAVGLSLMLPSPAIAGHVRPEVAAGAHIPFVPAHDACTAGNRLHGPPLAFPSCDPPVESSSAVGVGTPDNNGAAVNMEGYLDLDVQFGFPGPPEDSDVLIQMAITDVRCKAGTTACGNVNAVAGPDYTGSLQAAAAQRTSDHWNAVAAGGGPDPATVVDVPGFWIGPVAFGCAQTADANEGSTCTANTSSNAIVPQAIKDGKRTVVEFGQWTVFDGGPDGLTATSPNYHFARTGIFIP